MGDTWNVNNSVMHLLSQDASVSACLGPYPNKIHGVSVVQGERGGTGRDRDNKNIHV